MKIKTWGRVVCCFFLLMSSLAHAESSASLDIFSCTGSLESSLTDGVFYSCSGNMTMSGGSLFSDTKITLESGGLLFLENLSITAPIIQLSSIWPYGAIFIGQGTVIRVPGFEDINLPSDGVIKLPDGPLTGRDLTKDGSTITINPIISSVPEPESYGMLIAGLGVVTLRLQQKRS
ncbi:MAG: PEP-CTERM sorting domain-containing protein [Candidatus Methylopumilus sp.]